MKNEILVICCLVFLSLGSVLVFLAKKIVKIFNVTNEAICMKICKIIGIIVTIVALIGIYIID